MKSHVNSRLLQEMLTVLGLKNLVWQKDYWVLGVLGLGLEVSARQLVHPMRLIVTKPDFNWREKLTSQGIELHPFYSPELEESGYQFQFKDFHFQVSETSIPASDVAEIKLFLAMKTLIDIYGPELVTVLGRYLSYELSLERAFSEYFGQGVGWRERMMALGNPLSREEVLSAIS